MDGRSRAGIIIRHFLKPNRGSQVWGCTLNLKLRTACCQKFLRGRFLILKSAHLFHIHNHADSQGSDDGQRHLGAMFNKPLPKIDQLVRMCFCRFHGRRIMETPMKNASHKWFGLDAALSRD